MSQYTMEIRELVNNPLTPLFNFDYPFYCESEQMKKEFEEKFINHYFFHEIGCETFGRWEQMLKSRLVLKMPYYRQLYETYLASKDLNFLLNKDLLETIEHTITQSSNGLLQNNASFNQQSSSNTTLSNQQEGNSTQEESSNQQSTTEATSNHQNQSTSDTTASHQNQTTSDTSSTHQNQINESRIENGVSQASLETGYLTGVSQTTGSDENQSQTNQTGSDENHSQTNQTGSDENQSQTNQSGSSSLTLTNEQSLNQTSSDETGTEGTSSGEQQTTNQSNLTEKTTLVSQGNIGITSSAQLLKEWRDVLLNMDELIIKDCEDLFIQIY